MTYPWRRNALIATVCIAVLAACGTSTSANQAADTLGPIGVAPLQPAGAESGAAAATPSVTTEEAVASPPVQVPAPVLARDDTGHVFSVTDSVPDSLAPVQITDPRILFVGDSVSLGMAIGSPDPMDAYVQSLGWKVTLDGRVGRFTDEGIRVLQKRSSEIHQVLVLMLGNNYGGNQDQFRLQIAQILQLASSAKRIIMFTVPLYEPKEMQVNQVLHDAAAADPRLTIIDWETASRSFKGALNSDGIHPTDYGAMILDQMLAVTLGPAPGGPADATLPTVGDKNMPVTPFWVNTNKGEGKPSIGDPTVTIPPYRPRTTTTAPRSVGTTKTTTTLAGSGGGTPTTQPTAGSTATTATGGATTTKASGVTTTTTVQLPTPTRAPAPTQAPTTKPAATPAPPPSPTAA